MITVLEHGNSRDIKDTYYEINCSCGCKFICCYTDLRFKNKFLSKINKGYIVCPDCREPNYITTSSAIVSSRDTNFGVRTVKQITFDEYTNKTQESYKKD